MRHRSKPARPVLSAILAAVMFPAALGATACSKTAPPPAAPAPVAEAPAQVEPAAPPPAPAPDPAAEAKAAEDAKAAAEKQKQAAAVAEAEAKVEADAATEAARWTPEMHKAAEALVAKVGARPADYKPAMIAILKSPHRTPGAAARDKYRHPLETLGFFGVAPSMTVLEMGMGEGWYTELLAPLVAKHGKLFVAGVDPETPPGTMRAVSAKRVSLFFARSPEIFGTVQVAAVQPPDQLTLGPDGSVDMVLAMREMHNWHRRKAIPKYLAAIHAVLKDKGILGIEQHRAKADGNADETADKGYLPEKWLISTVEAAGFKFVGKSEVNTNKKDTKDYPEGVWTLPPTFQKGDTDKAKYQAIGESDRMTLKFVKVAAK
jgi:predicted methyltransferase